MDFNKVIKIPLVSIVVTCYNRENTIERALNSLINQTVKDFEIIIVDDASNDSSVEIISKFISENSGYDIKLIQLDSNEGQNHAINVAFPHCNSDLIAFLDSDDVWKPHFIEFAVIPLTHISNREFGFLYCWSVSGRRLKISGDNIYRKVLRKGLLSRLGTLVIRKQIFQLIMPLSERVRHNDMCQDDEICFRLSKITGCIVVKKRLYVPIGNFPSSGSDPIKTANGWEHFYLQFKPELILIGGKIAWIKSLARLARIYSKTESGSEIEKSKKRINDYLLSVNYVNRTITNLLFLYYQIYWQIDWLYFTRKNEISQFLIRNLRKILIFLPEM